MLGNYAQSRILYPGRTGLLVQFDASTRHRLAAGPHNTQTATRRNIRGTHLRVASDWDWEVAIIFGRCLHVALLY